MLIESSTLLNDLIYCKELQGRRSVEAVAKIIKDQPKAYDIEEVQSQVRNILCKDCKTYYCSECKFMKVIDLIQLGGTNEII